MHTKNYVYSGSAHTYVSSAFKCTTYDKFVDSV